MSNRTNASAEERFASVADVELAPRTDVLAEDLRIMIADAEGLLKEVQALAGDAATAARIQLERKMRDVRAKLDAVHASTVVQARKSLSANAAYVRRERVLVVAAAATFGLIVGALLARR
jgi:ElaB/YqjD/DUF883 family membrane-anchored ribosome-binding protein